MKRVFSYLKVIVFVSLLVGSFVLLSPDKTQANTVLYFNAAVDNDWNTLGNWWQDAGHTVHAGALPTVADEVIVTEAILSNAGPAASVSSAVFSSNATLGMELTVSVSATFNDSTTLNNGHIIGPAIFNEDSVNYYSTIDGDTTFNDNAYNNNSTITGTVTFNDNSYNQGNITGDVIFNDNSYNEDGGITGNATFNGSSYVKQGGTIGGEATFNTAYYNGVVPTGGTLIISGTSYYAGTVSGSMYGSDNIRITKFIFKDSSYNKQGTIQANARFLNSSYNDFSSTVTGDACFAAGATNNGSVTGTVSVCDVAAPLIASSLATPSIDSVIIQWTTDEAASSSVSYGLSSAYGSASTSVGTTTHRIVLSGLTAQTTYHFMIHATDASLNTATSSDLIFTTSAPAPVADTFVPAPGSQTAVSGSSGGVGGAASTETPAAIMNRAAQAQNRQNNPALGDGSNGVNGMVPGDSSASSLGTDGNGGLGQGEITLNDQTAPKLESAGIAPGQVFDENLSRRDEDADVHLLQKFLNIMGFRLAVSGPGAPGEETSYFGPLTKAALVKFQTSVGITPATGNFGPETRNFVNTLLRGLFGM